MARVACTMMQKDESVLLEPWLKYHGNLFGFENIFLFDNGSIIPSVNDTLAKYEYKGIHLNRSFLTVADYALKGEIISDCLLKMQSSSSYDVAVPLDCDEFLVLKDGAGATTAPKRILGYLNDLSKLGGLFRVDTQFFNIINRPGEFGVGDYTKTVLVLDGTFVSSDHGHHFCRTSTTSHYSNCNLAYVHYHYKPLAMLRNHARAKLAPFVDVNDLVDVSTYTGPGHHLCRYLTMTEEEFQVWHGGSDFYQFHEFNDMLRSLGATIVF